MIVEPHVEEVIQGNPHTARDVDLGIDHDEEMFLLSVTGIETVDQLQSHILRIQGDAEKIFPYPCIRRFDFVKLKMPSLPCYPKLLQLAKERTNALLLDIGCCCGTDVRKAILDGFPAEQIIASDLRPGFWDVGHKLFLSDPQTFPVTFLPGDVLSSSFMGSNDISYSGIEGPHPDHRSLNTLAPLHGRISFIHASNLFHLFSEVNQLAVAHKLGSLLAPEPGSMIFGVHVSRPEKGFRTEAPPPAPGYLGNLMFCHNVDSWKDLWEEKVFKKGSVKADVELAEQPRADLVLLEPGVKFYQLRWCVTRM